MKGCPKKNFKTERVLNLCLDSFQRKFKVLNLLGTLLDPRLIFLVLLRLSDQHSLSGWARHHRVLPLGLR